MGVKFSKHELQPQPKLSFVTMFLIERLVLQGKSTCNLLTVYYTVAIGNNYLSTW